MLRTLLWFVLSLFLVVVSRAKALWLRRGAIGMLVVSGACLVYLLVKQLWGSVAAPWW